MVSGGGVGVGDGGVGVGDGGGGEGEGEATRRIAHDRERPLPILPPCTV